MSRVSASSAVFARGVLLGLRLELPTFVIDNNEMKPRCFEQPYEVGDTREAWSAFEPRHHLVRYAGAQCQFALTQVGKSPSSAHISIGGEVLHADQSGCLAGWRVLASEPCG